MHPLYNIYKPMEIIIETNFKVYVYTNLIQMELYMELLNNFIDIKVKKTMK